MPTTTVSPPVESARRAEWARIEHSREFVELIRAKARFVVPATIFFLVYYFALPVLVGYAPGLMEREVFGHFNVAYLFALSQFAMTWIVMALYVRRARDFDARAAAIVANVKRGDLA